MYTVLAVAIPRAPPSPQVILTARNIVCMCLCLCVWEGWGKLRVERKVSTDDFRL